MDEDIGLILLIMVGLAILSLPLLLIAAMLKIAGLGRRVAALEARLASGENLPALPVVAVAPPIVQRPPVETAPLPLEQLPLARAPNAFVSWASANWVYLVSAASLALAGVFFVQYGVENGLLPPPLRVFGGIVFGLALIALSEVLRRRFGADEAAGATIYLPSVFGGAGLVAIFAAITAGRLLYDLYGVGLTFAGFVLTALAAIWLGWRNGPLLVAVGLIGAAAAPLLVGGAGGAPAWLYGYYLLVAAIGLTVDAWRGWHLISALSLVLAQCGLGLMKVAGAGPEAWALAQFALVILSLTLPLRTLTPRHAGPKISSWLRDTSGPRPSFAVWLAGANLLAASAQIAITLPPQPMSSLILYAVLAALAVLLLWWASEAEGLADLAVIPALAFCLRLGLDQPTLWLWQDQILPLRAPESSAPLWVSFLVAMVLAVAGAGAWAACRNGRLWPAAVAVIFPTAALILLEARWTPAAVLGAYVWALHVIVVAGGMVYLAAGFARRDADQSGPGRRAAWASLAALVLIALACFVLTTAAALTLALSLLLVVASWLDRRFTLPEMGWFLQLGAAVLSYRLIADPGLDWAVEARLIWVLLAFGAVILGTYAAKRLLPKGRPLPIAVMESLCAVAAALLANALIARALIGQYLEAQDQWRVDYLSSHWGVGLLALPWLLVIAAQCWRLGPDQPKVARKVRGTLAFAAAILVAGLLLLGVMVFNPLWDTGPARFVIGPVVLNSLLVAYGLPGLALILLARHPRLLRNLGSGRALSRLALGSGVLLVVFYVVCAIRHLWQGHDLSRSGILQAELYTYTLALLLTGAVLLWQALAKRSGRLRRVAMAVIALTVAKVFLWDVAGLSGLVRVLSFAGLGLSLAGLAWLNRWAGQNISEGGATE